MVKYIENFRINYKTELCKNFMENGYCEFNDECAYAHGMAELNFKQKTPNKNYKTKMCKKWHVETPGKCSYGEKCQFIHNENSIGRWSTGFGTNFNYLVSMPQLMKYKHGQAMTESTKF